jgi:hypothetical protein
MQAWDSDACSIACGAFERDAQERRRIVRREILHRGKHLTEVCDSRRYSNINSSDKSCGKLKAKRVARIVLRQGQAFLRRDCDGGTLPAYGFAADVPEYTHASATLNDTELLRYFRRKNTRRKSFLGHARRLNDLPIEAAKARPTPAMCCPQRKMRRPTVGTLKRVSSD